MALSRNVYQTITCFTVISISLTLQLIAVKVLSAGVMYWKVLRHYTFTYASYELHIGFEPSLIYIHPQTHTHTPQCTLTRSHSSDCIVDSIITDFSCGNSFFMAASSTVLINYKTIKFVLIHINAYM